MTTTTRPPRPDPTRTGAVWVTGTGAFLLLAAAAVFTAMRWDQIPDAAKLGALALATGACLVAGRRFTRTLPATSRALFHLGIFLLPLDVLALGARADMGWEALLLAQGLAATLMFGWAAHTERSVVLRGGFTAAVVVLAAGIGATTAVPAGLALAGASVLALLARREAMAGAWAATAGLAPLLAFVDQADRGLGSGVISQLGLVGTDPRAAAVVTGLVSGAVLALIGRHREDVGLALVGVAVGVLGIAASWTGVDAEASSTAVALAAGFLIIEGIALATRRDPFWHAPTEIVAGIAEVLAGLATVVALAVVVASPLHGYEAEPVLALSSLVLAAGWLSADRRRGRLGLPFAAVAAAVSAVAAVELATTNDLAVAGALGAVAVAALLSGHRASPLIVLFGTVGATVLAIDTPAACLGAGAAGSMLAAESAVRFSARATSIPASRPWTWSLAAASLLPGTVMVGALLDASGWDGAGLILAAVLATGVAAVLDRARIAGLPALGTVARVAATGTLLLAGDLRPVEIGVVAIVVASLSIGDALRLGDPRVALGASVAVPVAIGVLAQSTGLTMPATGVAMTLGAAVLAGLGGLVGRRWALPVGASVGIAALSGLALAVGQTSSLADAVMVLSGIGLAGSVERGRLDAALVSSLALTAGIWLRLSDGGVTASEPYLLPVAVLLLAAGVRARSTGASSWVAYGPVVALSGGAALAERIGGGVGWHALVAGTVGVVAVAIGGWRRLAAPLLLGTALLVSLVGYETVAITAGLPTWTWLAVGGSVLLAVGVAMERHDLGPLETGRRLVDVVDDHFA